MSVNSARKVLVLSPSASHPQDYGNRNRIFQTTSKFKEMGYEVHFILYPYEADWVNEIPESAADMRRAWESFAVIPPSMPAHQLAAGSHHLVDEWWDPEIGRYLEWLFAREYFDVFVVNYTFFSKAFEYAPDNTVKVLDTHDLFTGRKELFQAFGAEPEFFYTTAQEEQIAFNRADIVLAIKDAEAETIRGMTKKNVISVPFDIAERPKFARPERLVPNSELRVGFIGALNTVNSLNMERFLEKFARCEKLYVPPPIKIVVAGDVCRRLTSTSAAVDLRGRVPSVDEFYSDVDVIVAPMEFSTGMKIKVGEALSYGKPVVSTHNGFDGFPSVDPFHALPDVESVCRALMTLAFDRNRLLTLEERSKLAAQLARRRSAAGYEALAAAIQKMSAKIVFITDQKVWETQSIQQARLAQWCEFCSYLSRVALLYVGEGGVGKFPKTRLQLTRFVDIYDLQGDPAKVAEMVDEFSKTHNLIEIVISAAGEKGRDLWATLREKYRSVTLDGWAPDLVSMPVLPNDTVPADIWISRDAPGSPPGEGQYLSTSALRYVPLGLGYGTKATESAILVVRCKPDRFDEVGLEIIKTMSSDKLDIVDCEEMAGASEAGNIMTYLKGRTVPEMVVAVGTNTRAVEVVRCLATGWQSKFLHATSTRFPFLLGMADGSSTLCASYGDLVRYLSQVSVANPSATRHAHDAGWSLYWRHMKQSLSEINHRETAA